MLELNVLAVIVADNAILELLRRNAFVNVEVQRQNNVGIGRGGEFRVNLSERAAEANRVIDVAVAGARQCVIINFYIEGLARFEINSNGVHRIDFQRHLLRIGQPEGAAESAVGVNRNNALAPAANKNIIGLNNRSSHRRIGLIADNSPADGNRIGPENIFCRSGGRAKAAGR